MDASTMSGSATVAWRRSLPALLLLLTLILVAYRETAIAMVGIWARSETFTHAFLVPPIVAWLIWRQRHVLARTAPRPFAWALPAMICAGAAWLLGDLVAVNAVTQFSFVALMVLSVPAVLGLPIARSLMFPLGFLFFAVPVGEFLMPQFMLWTADFTIQALRLSGIPVYREGLQFVIPSGVWSVVEACSGIRYLIASVVVGTLFAYLNFRSTRKRLIFVGVSMLVPVVANWLRAYMIVMLGHLSNNEIAAGADHLIYGWVFFGIVIVLMFMIGARWAEDPIDRSAEAAPTSSPKPGLRSAYASWGIAALAAAVVLLPHWGLQTVERAELSLGQARIAPAAVIGAWRVGDPVVKFEPAYQRPAAALNKTYVLDQDSVGLFVGYYRRQGYDNKLVSSTNTLVPSQDAQWLQVETGSRTVHLRERVIDVRTARLREARRMGDSAATQLTVWSVYWINGRWTASDPLAKVWGALYRLLGRGDDAAVLIFYATDNPQGTGDAALQAFVSANLGLLDAQLRQARDGTAATVAQHQQLSTATERLK
jgi:exosortase A